MAEGWSFLTLTPSLVVGMTDYTCSQLTGRSSKWEALHFASYLSLFQVILVTCTEEALRTMGLHFAVTLMTSRSNSSNH